MSCKIAACKAYGFVDFLSHAFFSCDCWPIAKSQTTSLKTASLLQPEKGDTCFHHGLSVQVSRQNVLSVCNSLGDLVKPASGLLQKLFGCKVD